MGLCKMLNCLVYKKFQVVLIHGFVIWTCEMPSNRFSCIWLNLNRIYFYTLHNLLDWFYFLSNIIQHNIILRLRLSKSKRADVQYVIVCVNLWTTKLTMFVIICDWYTVVSRMIRGDITGFFCVAQVQWEQPDEFSGRDVCLQSQRPAETGESRTGPKRLLLQTLPQIQVWSSSADGNKFGGASMRANYRNNAVWRLSDWWNVLKSWIWDVKSSRVHAKS